MRILGRDLLAEFIAAHADARLWIENWIAEAERMQWRTPQDVKGMYATASFLAGNVVVFNVKGNRYRMVTLIAYQTGTIIVRWIGTHAEYDRR
jgi:mRNA interferase HigB